MTFTRGFSAFTAIETPAMSPAPPTGQTIASRSGTCCRISTPSVPWPAMMRGIYGDEERYRATYWSKWPGIYFPGDGAKRDHDGYFWVLGRVDDVINVAGHRIGTMEVESALVYLLSGPAYITGEIIHVDGGRHLI